MFLHIHRTIYTLVIKRNIEKIKKYLLTLKIKFMKNIILALALLFTISTVFTGCREEKSTGDKIEEVVDDVGDGLEDAADEVEDEL